MVWGVGSCSLVRQQQSPHLEVEVFQPARLRLGKDRLELQIFSPGRRARALVAYLELEAPSGKRLGSEAQWQVPGGVASRFELEFRVQEPGLHRADLRIYEPASGDLVFRREDLHLRVWPRLEFTHDRSYYTTEEFMRFRARLHGVEEGVNNLQVELRGDAIFHEQVERVFRGSEVYGDLSMASLPPGSYTLQARLSGVEGVEDSVSLQVYKYLPGEREIKIDLFTRTLLRDGKPFFPIGLYWLRTEVLGEVRRLRFNAGDYYYKLQAGEIAELMDAAAQEDVAILLELSDFIRRQEEPDYRGIEAVIKRYRNHPALLAWYLIDEPAETGVEPSHTREIYEQIRELDPYHPVYLVNNRPHLYAAHIDASDILGIDVYPIPKYPITRVREYMREAHWSSLGRKPVWLIAQAFGGVEHWPRAPTPAELRNMVYQGLVQGASGVLFYRFCQEDERHIQPAALWREVRTLAVELAELTPVLVAPDWSGRIDQRVGEPGVDIMIKQYEKSFYLFVVNYTRTPQRVRFSTRDLPPFSRAQALYRASRLRRQNGLLEANLAPLGVGVYRLESADI